MQGLYRFEGGDTIALESETNSFGDTYRYLLYNIYDATQIIIKRGNYKYLKKASLTLDLTSVRLINIRKDCFGTIYKPFYSDSIRTWCVDWGLRYEEWYPKES